MAARRTWWTGRPATLPSGCRQLRSAARPTLQGLDPQRCVYGEKGIRGPAGPLRGTSCGGFRRLGVRYWASEAGRLADCDLPPVISPPYPSPEHGPDPLAFEVLCPVDGLEGAKAVQLDRPDLPVIRGSPHPGEHHVPCRVHDVQPEGSWASLPFPVPDTYLDGAVNPHRLRGRVYQYQGLGGSRAYEPAPSTKRVVTRRATDRLSARLKTSPPGVGTLRFMYAPAVAASSPKVRGKRSGVRGTADPRRARGGTSSTSAERRQHNGSLSGSAGLSPKPCSPPEGANPGVSPYGASSGHRTVQMSRRHLLSDTSLSESFARRALVFRSPIRLVTSRQPTPARGTGIRRDGTRSAPEHPIDTDGVQEMHHLR